MDWKVLLSTFTVLFLAELGDKTQLAVISLTCQHQKPLAVFLGATLALATVTLVGVVGGQAVAQIVPEESMRRIAAAAFVILGLLMWFKIL
ncbi:MAG: TMEM165/GDT1 family protein [Chloroflexi bacterium]|nr:TMEM165/GDT1 family protein [Chloroflexota bacterium]